MDAVSRDRYRRHRALLIGTKPPGNGKTISLKAIMKEVTVPLLYVKSFHSESIGI